MSRLTQSNSGLSVFRRRVLQGFALALLSGACLAEPEPEWPEWDLEAQVDAVSDGELSLLPDGVPEGSHIHRNEIRLEPGSLEDGWVTLDQCHEHLDAVPALQVTYNPERIRELRITSTARIGRAWVEGSSVQLENVGSGAQLCVSAQSRALLNLGEGYYRLRNGPYMRRFLDGYYPMRVLLDVRYPEEMLDFIRPNPVAQPGFRVRAEPGRLRIDTSFEGRLYTCMDFGVESADVDSVPSRPCPEA
jgi:hypothetical protein